MLNIERSVERKTHHRPDRPKNHTEKLKSLLENISRKVNQDTQQQYGISGLLNSDCTISMGGFSESGGGIYRDEDVERHRRDVKKMELDFSSANNPNVQDFYRSEHGIETPEGIVKRWKENKMKDKNGQTEMAVTALLSKILKDDFLVVRTASYDDYRHGIDNIILNKRTGEVICAFDEVHEGGRGERTNAKIEKVKKIAKKGGTDIAYGLNLENGKLTRSRMKNIPVFFLGLKSEELMKLLSHMEYDPDAGASSVEYEVYTKLVASLRDQQQKLLASPEVPNMLKEKLKTFENSLLALESIGQAQVKLS
jgi:hypothetical protein